MLKHLMFAFAVGVAIPVAHAGLTPQEVAIVAMAQSPESRRLAEYYATVRGVPADHIMLLEGKPLHELSRAEWETKTRPAIRQWLREKKLDDKIRCFVTCWDVPLRIGRRDAKSPEVVERADSLVQVRTVAVDTLGELVSRLGAIGTPGNQPLARPAWEPNTPRDEITAAVETAFRGAQERLGAMSSQDDNRKKQMAMLERAFGAAVGVNGLLRSIARSGKAETIEGPAARQLNLLRGQLLGLTEGLQSISRLPDNLARDRQLTGLVQKTGGLLGVIEWIDNEQELLRTNETYSSFDSELAMVRSPDYVLFRWQPNLLHYRFDSLPDVLRDVIMVSRLEAPTLDIVKRIIDDAIRVEQQGLNGKVYLDARGISYDAAKDQPGSYGQYDESLRDLAARLKAHTKLEVVLDNEAALFQPGTCPDAAIYCGWYSLAKYVDAFDWNPGAVGYHIASAEARTLRQPGETGWCSSMLEDGVAATLGPVFEPYLASFPLPDDFFPLLMTGKYTLAEAYYRSNPFNSWAMVLIGDPLYKPFAKNPPLADDALPERLRGPRLSSNGPSMPEPGIPAVPEMPAIPGEPAIPEAPAIPKTSATPGEPAIPVVPAIPKTPATPGEPAIPVVPAIPETPATPGEPAIPEVPAIPQRTR